MYKITQEVNFTNGSKIEYSVSCPNASSTRERIATHGKHCWNKIEYGVYTCSECGCKMTMKTEFKEEEINV